MRWAICNGEVAAASVAAPGYDYECPECGKNVHLRRGDVREPHFAHNPGEGTEECDEFHPSDGSATLGGSGSVQLSIRRRRNHLQLPSECWWCGAKVYFHTNGNGDFVMFDSLGHPWPVHGCYLTERTPKADEQIAMHVREGRLIEGVFRLPNVYPLPTPSRIPRWTILLEGSIYNLGPLGGEDMGDWRYGESKNRGLWREAEVYLGDYTIGTVYLPESAAERVQLGSLVSIDARWIRSWDETRLVATSVRVWEGAFADGYTVFRGARISDTLACYYCGGRLGPGDPLSFDEKYRVECNTCCGLQGDLPSRDFLRQLRRISRNLGM